MIQITRDNVYYFFKGRVALYVLLKAMGVSKDDEVILPGFTCVVVPNAVRYLGARPVYVDIHPETFNINENKIEEKITKRTKVIIAQHSFGIPADMDKINTIAKKHDLYVIEDSAHAIGSLYKGKEVGTLGDAAFFSTQWSKPFTTGLGGFCINNNKRLNEKIKKVHDELLTPSLKETGMLFLEYIAYTIFYRPSTFWILMNLYRNLYQRNIILGSSDSCELDMNKPDRYGLKMSGFQKHLLKKKFQKMDMVNEHRKNIVQLYEKRLKHSPIKMPVIKKGIGPVFLRYPVLVKDKPGTLKNARKQKLEIGDWFVSPLHPLVHNLEKLHYHKGMCPVAENICAHIINLPTHSGISLKTADHIVNFILSD